MLAVSCGDTRIILGVVMEVGVDRGGVRFDRCNQIISLASSRSRLHVNVGDHLRILLHIGHVRAGAVATRPLRAAVNGLSTRLPLGAGVSVKARGFQFTQSTPVLVFKNVFRRRGSALTPAREECQGVRERFGTRSQGGWRGSRTRVR